MGMKFVHCALTLCLLLSLALLGVACGCDDDDDDSSGGHGDDDAADDDEADDDNDAADDDDNDDESPDVMIERVDGGYPGLNGTSLAAGAEGAIYLAIDYARTLVLYTVTPDKALNEEDVLRFAKWPKVRTDGEGFVHILYLDLAAGAFAVVSNRTGAWASEPVQIDDPELSDKRYWGFAVDASGGRHMCFCPADHFELMYASDASGTWQAQSVDASALAGAGCDIAIDGAGHAHIGYGVLFGALHYATNAGGLWATTEVDPEDDTGAHVSIALDADGHAHLAYQDADDDMKYATNASGAWSTEEIAAGAFRTGTAIAVDGDGNAHVTFGDWWAGLDYATNASGAWVTAALDDENGGWCSSLAFRSDGVLFAADYDSEPGLRLFNNATGGWTASTLTNDHSVGDSLAAAADASNRLHLVYNTGGYDPLWYATNASGAWVTEQAGGDYDQAASASLGVDGAGFAHVAFFRNNNDDLYYATNATGAWLTEAVDETDDVGYYPSLVTTADGAIHISYGDNTNYFLMYAVNDGDGWDIETADASGLARYDGAMALDADGHAHIVHLHDDLMLYYTTNASGSWTTEQVDATHGAYSGMAVAVDPVGSVLVCFRDYLDDSLMLAVRYAGEWSVGVLVEGTEAFGYGAACDIALDDSAGIHVAYNAEDFDEGVYAGVYYATDASGDWTFAPIDAAGAMGEHLSLMLTGDGLAHVAYSGADAVWHAAFAQGYAGPAKR
jgi:hypothetical protein